MTDPELLLRDIQRRQRQRQEVAATDRLADEQPNPIRGLVAETGEALVQLGTLLRTWGGEHGESGQPEGSAPLRAEAASQTTPISPRPRPCTELASLSWEKGERVYSVTIGAPKSSR